MILCKSTKIYSKPFISSSPPLHAIISKLDFSKSAVAVSTVSWEPLTRSVWIFAGLLTTIIASEWAKDFTFQAKLFFFLLQKPKAQTFENQTL